MIYADPKVCRRICSLAALSTGAGLPFDLLLRSPHRMRYLVFIHIYIYVYEAVLFTPVSPHVPLCSCLLGSS